MAKNNQLGDKPMINISCRMSEEDIEAFRKLGGGSYTLGVRRAARMLRNNELADVEASETASTKPSTTTIDLGWFRS